MSAQHRRALLVLLLAIACSRLPFLDAGYGANVDAWRVARVGHLLMHQGVYEVSRFPGYPVQEILSAPFWAHPVIMNGLSATFSLAAAVALYFIGQRLHCRDSLLLAVAFAMTPVVFVSSVTSKDYIWATAFCLWAFFAVMNGRAGMGGLLLAFGVGSRITSAAMFLPLAMILFGASSAEPRRKMAIFSLSALLTSILLFAPVWWRYRLGFLQFYENHFRPDVRLILSRATVGVWGSVGVMAIGVALVWAMSKRASEKSILSFPNPLIRPALILIVAIYLLAYWRLPDQAGYLVPIVAASLLLLASFVPRLAFQAICIGLCLSPWLEGSRTELSAGQIIADRRERLASMRDTQRFVSLTEEKFDGTIVVGGWEPLISVYRLTQPTHNDYVYVLNESAVKRLHASGINIGYASEVVRAFNQRVTKVDLGAEGAHNIRTILLGRP